MEERRPGTGVDELDGPPVNGSSLSVSQVQIRPPGPRESLEALTPREASELPGHLQDQRFIGVARSPA